MYLGAPREWCFHSELLNTLKSKSKSSLSLFLFSFSLDLKRCCSSCVCPSVRPSVRACVRDAPDEDGDDAAHAVVDADDGFQSEFCCRSVQASLLSTSEKKRITEVPQE